MNKYYRISFFMLIFLCVNIVAEEAHNADLFAADKLSLDHLNIILKNATAAMNKGALNSTFNLGAAYQQSVMLSPSERDSWDWTGNDGLSVDISNHDATSSLGLYIGVLDTTNPAGNSIHYNVSIPPGKTRTIFMALDDPKGHGMNDAPPLPSGSYVPDNASGKVAITHIYSIIFTQRDKITTAKRMSLGNIRLISRYAKMVDNFGQYTQREWKGKVKSDTDLHAQKAEEDKDLTAHPRPADRDSYGGWKDGPKLDQARYFRTTQYNGRWYLVTPEGHLYFAVGMDDVGWDAIAQYTFIMSRSDPEADQGAYDKARENMFEWVPPTTGNNTTDLNQYYNHGTDPLNKNKDTWMYNFYNANIDRKYRQSDPQSRDDIKNLWVDITLKRMDSWGFNSLGPGAGPEVTKRNKIPYQICLYAGQMHAAFNHVSTQFGDTVDPFDPRFGEAFTKSLTNYISDAIKSDPWLIGYYVDCEMPWGSNSLSLYNGSDPQNVYQVVLNALNQDPNRSPAKNALVAKLKAMYKGEISKLNANWGLQGTAAFTDWSELLKTGSVTRAPDPSKKYNKYVVKINGQTVSVTAGMKNDLSSLISYYADQYFRVVSTALKARDPNHLYFGEKFVGVPIEVMQSAARYCDAISIDYYYPALDPSKLQLLSYLSTTDAPGKINKPVMIAEFNFISNDRGMFGRGTGSDVIPTQADRGKGYQGYIKSVIDNPNFVGCNWYMYKDQVVTGAHGGENDNNGFVSVTDTPFPELVDAARSINAKVYDLLKQAKYSQTAQ